MEDEIRTGGVREDVNKVNGPVVDNILKYRGGGAENFCIYIFLVINLTPAPFL